jgi:hypothetical protein
MLKEQVYHCKPFCTATFNPSTSKEEAGRGDLPNDLFC